MGLVDTLVRLVVLEIEVGLRWWKQRWGKDYWKQGWGKDYWEQGWGKD